VFRYPGIDKGRLAENLESILGKTKYYRAASRQQAPEVTNCFSAIYYIYSRSVSMDLPLAFIGDMPRVFNSSCQWELLSIERNEAKYGDVLFVGEKGGDRIISHVALVLGVDQIFHCCFKAKTAVIQDDREFFSHYEQGFDIKQMLSYTDPRNKA
jgi:cell wall-associated NlpC family hydrolase